MGARSDQYLDQFNAASEQMNQAVRGLRDDQQNKTMAALGTMATHVGHDFNDLLATILRHSALLKASANMDAGEREQIAGIERAAQRGTDLTGHLLAFAHGGSVRFGPVELRTVIADTMRLAEPSLPSSLKTDVIVPGSDVIVDGDSRQLQHALFNIVANARDAMPGGGNLDIVLGSDGSTATVIITDNGPGMDDETRTRIFEPFFSTRPLGSGNGLGMAITHGLIRAHHGEISVTSTLGSGTSVAIKLPILAGIVSGNANAADAAAG